MLAEKKSRRAVQQGLADFLKQAQRLLDAQELPQAAALVKSGLLQWPGALRLHLMNGEILEAMGKPDQAISALGRALDRFPGQTQPAVALAHLCLRLGRAGQARAALAVARKRGLSEEGALRLELLIAKADGTWANAASAAEQIAKRESERLAQVLLSLAQARLHTGNPAGAEEAASRALVNDPQLITAALVAAHAAAEMGDAARMLMHYRRLAALAPDDPRWPLRIVATLSLAGQYTEAVQELEAVLRRWSDNALVRRYLVRAPLGGSLLDDALHAATPPDDAAAEADESEDESSALAGLNKREAARSAAENRINHSGRQEVTALQALLAAGPSDRELRRPVVIDDLREEVVIGRCADSDHVVLVFTAINDRMWMPLSLFDRYMAALGVTAIYVKDFQRLLHLNGVRSLAADYAGTLAALRDIAARHGAAHLYTIGHSGGGRAAIRYGVDLGAERIVSFGGATGRAPCLIGTDRHFNGLIWRRALAHVGEDMLDLRPFLATHRHSSVISLVFAEEIEGERTDAHYLDGLPGVILHPVAATAHDTVLRSLAETGRLYGTLATLLALGSPDGTTHDR